MVAGLSRRKKAHAAHVEQLSNALEELRRTADALTEAIDRDAAAYDAVLAAFKLPQGTAEEQKQRDAAIQSATRGAAEVPMQVAETAVALYERIGQLEKISAASMRSDLRVARLMAAAGARGALENVAINLESLADAASVQTMRLRAKALEERLADAQRAAGA
jgi:formiminotetrahydrofolate cyclodeaminase